MGRTVHDPELLVAGRRRTPDCGAIKRSHACEPGHVADLVTTAVQGPRAARSGGWEISSGRANHKDTP